MIKLSSVYDNHLSPVEGSIGFLYDLLAERTTEISISHKSMPLYAPHAAFVRSRPYREWMLIIAPNLQAVGAIYLTHLNEIGIFIKKSEHRKGLGRAAIKLVLAEFSPLPRIIGQRFEYFTAHVAPGNEPSRKLFESLGGKLIQVTYQL